MVHPRRTGRKGCRVALQEDKSPPRRSTKRARALMTCAASGTRRRRAESSRRSTEEGVSSFPRFTCPFIAHLMVSFGRALSHHTRIVHTLLLEIEVKKDSEALACAFLVAPPASPARIGACFCFPRGTPKLPTRHVERLKHWGCGIPPNLRWGSCLAGGFGLLSSAMHQSVSISSYRIVYTY